jgi:DNA-binding response OmpR family regulator
MLQAHPRTFKVNGSYPSSGQTESRRFEMEAQAKILVVDDEEKICRNVAKILAKNNYEVSQALNAQEALEKMAKESFALLISDIVMPGRNGLELLKLVKRQWPLTKALMMTAYASTDTAVKAIRLGALDYLPKPFTPDELRDTVKKALNGELMEVPTTAEEKESIDVIDLDIPFDADEVAKVTGEEYAKMLGPSDMPVVEVKMPEPLEGFCEVGQMVCDIFKKLGATCKAGTKKDECPQKKAKKGKAASKRGPAFDADKLIGVDQPFNYDEVVAVTGPEYVETLHQDGVAFVPYEELKDRVAAMLATRRQRGRIDVDVPFDADEVARVAGEAYARTAGRSDVPVVEVKATEPLEGFCEVGQMVCDIFKKLGVTCKAGTKKGECPQKKAKKGKVARKRAPAFDAGRLIGIDFPFDYEEVAAVTGPAYVEHLVYDGTVQMPYEKLKARMASLLREKQMPRAAQRQLAAEPSVDILVIDDEAAVNNNLRKILTRKGYEVDQAFSKEEALQKLEARSYSVVLLDLRMPGIKGLELLSAVRVLRSEAKVIIITGYASIETAVEAARMGALYYLPKPFTPDEIRSVTEKAFQLAA